MIILVSHDNCYTFNRFLKDCGRIFRDEIRLIFYADLAHCKTLPTDIYLFTDLERLDATQIELAMTAERQLTAAGMTVLNAPSRVLRRYDLLQALYRKGINRFRAYRLEEDRTQFQYPVFLRLEREHQGNLSPLLHNAQEVANAIQKANQRGLPNDNLLLVEYCEVRSPDGIYRKYSAFKIGAHCFPRHVINGRDWVSKSPDTIYEKDENCIRQEQEYLEEFPHQAEVEEIFQLSGIEYGRIDYSLQNGTIQIWEINTNPTIIPEKAIAPLRQAGQDRVHQNVCAAFRQLISSAPGARRRIPFQLSTELRQQLQISPADQALHPIRRLLRPLRPERVKRFAKRRIRKKSKR